MVTLPALQDGKRRPAAQAKIQELRQELGLTDQPGPYTSTLSKSEQDMLNRREREKLDIEWQRLDVAWLLSVTVFGPFVGHGP